LFDSSPHGSSIPQDLVARDTHDLVPLLGQILVSALIVLATFIGLMMLSIDFDDQLQRDATEVDRVRRDRIFTTELLISTTTISKHLPYILSKLVRSGSLVAGKSNRLWIPSRSTVHAAPPFHDHGGSAPHPQPFSPLHEGEHDSPSCNGEKGASLD
jgi:hypothetical protein